MHRTEYDFIESFPHHMRDGASISFTRTLIEMTNKNSRALIGAYISVYDI